jgi:alkaline phosphatase D
MWSTRACSAGTRHVRYWVVVNRRDWLVTCGQLAGTAALGLSAPGCEAPPAGEPLPPVGRADDVTALPPAYLTATLDPRENSAIAWLGARRATVAHLELWPEGAAAEQVATVELAEARGLTAAVALVDLVPATEYRYRAFFEDAGYGPWLRLRTAPPRDAVEPVSFVFSGDMGNAGELEDAYALVAGHDVPFYVHLGDWPYADGAPAARSLTEFRACHRAVREPTAVQEWLWSMPLVAIYDDHDILENWAGKEMAAEDPERLLNGLRIWREYFPFAGDSAYREFRWGRLAHLFVVDTRFYRDRRDPLRDRWQMLGEVQLAWLTAALRESDAVFKILVSTVPFGFDGYEDDDWSAFPADRARVLETVREAGIEPLIVISADRHWFAARHLDGSVREYQVGPLTAGLGKYPDSFPPNVVASALVRNFGRIDIDADLDRGVARLRFTCLEIDGTVIHREGVEAPL